MSEALIKVGVLVIGIGVGIIISDHTFVTDCERHMRVTINGTEYTCMKVPENGLAQNMEQLAEKYQLTHQTKEVYEEK